MPSRCNRLVAAARGRVGLGGRGRVFVVSDYERTFAHRPRCRIFQPLEAAVEAIMAGAQGERLRLARR